MRYEPHDFEAFATGLTFESGPRTVTRADIEDFARLSGDHTRLHTDDAYAALTPFGRVVAHGALNLAVATGLAYACGVFEGTVLAVADMSIRFERPVFPGDQLSLRMTVSGRDQHPRPDRGKVTFDVAVRNGAGREVLSGAWSVLVRTRPPEGP